MCRNIEMRRSTSIRRWTPEEMRAASMQFAREVSGSKKPSKAEGEAFQSAIDVIAGISAELLRSLGDECASEAPGEAARLKAKSVKR